MITLKSFSDMSCFDQIRRVEKFNPRRIVSKQYFSVNVNMKSDKRRTLQLLSKHSIQYISSCFESFITEMRIDLMTLAFVLIENSSSSFLKSHIKYHL